jgi:predicted FMN-binding regulatory protein PaiB
MRHTPHSLILGIAAAMLLAAPPAMAQEQPQQQPQQQPMTPPDFSQQQIEAFVDAATEVQRVQTELDAKAQEAQNPEEVAELQQEAQVEASQAVEESGLTIDEYAAIAQAANQDPELYAMIVDLMQQRSMQ